MKKEIEKKRLKKELKSLFKSMDYISDNYLNKEGINDKELEVFANIYQQLGMAWEFLGLQCGHWDGYKKTRDRKEVCKICGKVRDVDETYILMPVKGRKKIGRKKTPDSKKTVLSQDAWYNPDHPDPRLQKPIDLGNSFSEIAKNFSIRMNEFDKIDGGTNDKFLDLGFHVFMSVARSIESQIISREHEIPHSVCLKYQDIAIRLKDLAGSKSVNQFSLVQNSCYRQNISVIQLL